MAEFYRFFDSTIEDPRKYDADEFAEYFRQILTDGIFNGGTNLQITCEGNNMNVFVNEGYGWIKGYLYKVDDLGVELQLDTADVTYDRIDRVVLRWDKENRYIKAFVLKGTPAASPLEPELIRNDRIYEISLAQIRVIAGKSYIDSSQITDERLNSDVCGLVNSLVKVDTTTMQQEFDNFMSSLESEIFVTQDEFNSQANNVNSQIGNLNDDLGNIGSLNTTDKSNAVNAINEVKLQGNNIGTQITDLNNNVGDISSLNTTDKSNTVNAINELKSQKDNLGSEVSGLVSDIGSLSALATTDKTSLVNSINELFQNVDSGKTDLYSAIIDHLDVTPASKDFLDLYNTISSIINKGSGTYTTDNISVDGNYLNFSVPEKGVYNDSATIRAGDNDFIESNIRSGISIFGKTGTFTSDATASGSQILDGYTAYVNGQKITGIMPNKGSGDYVTDGYADSGTTLYVRIPTNGYYGDSARIYVSDTNFVPENIKNDVSIFGKVGTASSDATQCVSTEFDFFSGSSSTNAKYRRRKDGLVWKSTDGSVNAYQPNGTLVRSLAVPSYRTNRVLLTEEWVSVADTAERSKVYDYDGNLLYTTVQLYSNSAWTGHYHYGIDVGYDTYYSNYNIWTKNGQGTALYTIKPSDPTDLEGHWTAFAMGDLLIVTRVDGIVLIRGNGNCLDYNRTASGIEGTNILPLLQFLCGGISTEGEFINI
ncbi:MAG: hypothetical protein FH761_02365 [Firmicutes bacterium]|nr:hypothetical protein [Bacillota bacterium]